MAASAIDLQPYASLNDADCEERIIRARQALGDRGVVELLLRVEAIQTYWHLGADLCLHGERSEGSTYHASWRGVHHYATGSVQEERLAFAVEVDPQGQVAVIGEAP